MAPKSFADVAWMYKNCRLDLFSRDPKLLEQYGHRKKQIIEQEGFHDVEAFMKVKNFHMEFDIVNGKKVPRPRTSF